MITLEKISDILKTTERPKQIKNKAAVLIPIVKVDNQLHLLFQIRSQKLKWQPGDICFPGGKVEIEDINPEQTAKRETCEELGIPINEITILGQLPKFIASLGMVIYPFIGKIDSIKNLKLNIDEVESVFTVPLDWFKRNQPVHATMQVGHKPDNDFPYNLLPNRSKDWQKRSEHLVYFYQYNNYIIWGLTAQITKQFINTIQKAIK
ncbi:CoA pyrophosphatase [Gilliamella sp. B2840]|uniref:NUDIX hydrolase n=1 Tax=unclassified Gilliamella TaxID=2685620 RepID=UPI002269D846|nr:MULTISPECIES: CoA pyrophosphatase [unclassified Gilliamella]MCX8663859.1 CoA pyrophosphatase [Gilliamella sp. B2887]MCX8697897.1 CoA pyrophosphatase [Gilliamella sp. B3000]MCX8699537.1 CoA pyrophosphatase [Gilliamella sp. B2840]